MSAVRSEDMISLRPMTAQDVDAVVELERASYKFPWTAGIFNDCLRMGYHAFLLETEQGIQGYYMASVAVHEGHLLNLCVDDKVRGRGLGRQLLCHAMALFRTEQAETVFLEVRPTKRRPLPCTSPKALSKSAFVRITIAPAAIAKTP